MYDHDHNFSTTGLHWLWYNVLIPLNHPSDHHQNARPNSFPQGDSQQGRVQEQPQTCKNLCHLNRPNEQISDRCFDPFQMILAKMQLDMQGVVTPRPQTKKVVVDDDPEDQDVDLLG